ncbi:hypothetical protein HGRIS_007587 [Hohenbuehelia grisea]|uniref:Translin n=1 Tax=Hohenbuehelia grisea TaxID=104357 RepID=A0ABR3J5A0_9AGAR
MVVVVVGVDVTVKSKPSAFPHLDMDAFPQFRDHLDQYHDTREALIKASRDITNIAKKTIFLLHRLALERDNPSEAARQGRERLKDVQSIYAKCSPLIAGDNFYRYNRQVSPGLQEYIEALSFAHYLEHGTLISHTDVQASLADPNGVPYVILTVEDYLLGLSDLTGELMRFAISGIARWGGRAKALDVCAFVRACRAGKFFFLLLRFSLPGIGDVVLSECSLTSLSDDSPPEPNSITSALMMAGEQTLNASFHTR